jgi:hypothetical protein
VAVEVELPSPSMVGGFSTRDTPDGGPAVSVSVCGLDPMAPSAAAITVDPTELPVIFTLHEPDLVVQDDEPNVTGVPVWPKSTDSPDTGLPLPSVTVAIAVADELPSATMLDGLTDSARFLAGPVVTPRGAEADGLVPSLAVIVADPGEVLVISTEHEPVTPSVVHCVGLIETLVPLGEKLTGSPSR